MGSYRESLDCPGLNGKRSIEDVIEGHKATGQHDPKLWFLLTESHWPRAVVLLSPTVSGETLELVYLGLVPEARGRGIGDLAMRQALAVGWAGRYEQLSLAVDARNAPAMKLYFRHGFQRVSSRLAMMRDLRADYRPTLL
jgi:mycothiol synthase